MSKQKVLVRSKPYAFRLSAEDARVLYELAKAYGTNRSGVVRLLIQRAYGESKALQKENADNERAN